MMPRMILETNISRRSSNKNVPAVSIAVMVNGPSTPKKETKIQNVSDRKQFAPIYHSAFNLIVPQELVPLVRNETSCRAAGYNANIITDEETNP